MPMSEIKGAIHSMRRVPDAPKQVQPSRGSPKDPIDGECAVASDAGPGQLGREVNPGGSEGIVLFARRTDPLGSFSSSSTAIRPADFSDVDTSIDVRAEWDRLGEGAWKYAARGVLDSRCSGQRDWLS